MNTKKIKSTIATLAVILLFLQCNTLSAQQRVPTDVAAIVNMELEAGQKELAKLGYEICGSSLFGKKQDWYNETANTCITLHFDKKSKVIKDVAINTATTECKEKVEASRKVWEKYHDGPAPYNAPKLDEERKKLTDKGFKVSYWVDELVPGKRSEYWVNDDTQQTMYIVWEVEGTKWATTGKTDYEYGKNPRP